MFDLFYDNFIQKSPWYMYQVESNIFLITKLDFISKTIHSSNQKI